MLTEQKTYQSGLSSIAGKILLGMREDKTLWDVDELLVYLDAVHDMRPKRKIVQARLAKLCDEGLIKRVRFGIYEFKENP